MVGVCSVPWLLQIPELRGFRDRTVENQMEKKKEYETEAGFLYSRVVYACVKGPKQQITQLQGSNSGKNSRICVTHMLSTLHSNVPT